MTTRGRGTGRGLQPPRAIEDRDVLIYANKRVATSGPPSVQTFHKPPVVPRGRGRGGPPIPRGISFQRGGPSSARGRGRGAGSSSEFSSSRGRGIVGSRTSSNSRSRGGEADTYRPRYTSPPKSSRYPINTRQGDEEDWAEYRELQRDRERYMADRSSSSPPPRATRSRENFRRYSPSQPTLEETWSSKYPSQPKNQYNEDRSHHAGPSKYSSNVPIDLSQDDSSPPLPQNPLFDHPPPNPSSRPNTNGHNTRQHVIFNSSSPSLPPERPKELRLDPAFKRQPPAGPSSSRLSSPSMLHIRPNPTQNLDSLPSSTSNNTGKGSAAVANPPIPQVPRIPEPPAVPVEVKKMTFKPNNPNNPNPKSKDKDKDPKESEKDKGKGKEPQSEPEPGPVRVKAEPDIQVEIPERPKEEVIMEEPVDVKPHIKELENEVEHTSGGIRRSGTLAFSKEELPDCWAKNSTERSKARMAFRKSQREEMLSQGKKIGGTHWRDDGVAFDWTLPDTAIPNKDSVVVAPVPSTQVPRTSAVATRSTDTIEMTRPVDTSTSNTDVPPSNTAPMAPMNSIPTLNRPQQLKAPIPSVTASRPIASTNSNAIASSSRPPNTPAGDRGTSLASSSKEVKPASTKPMAAVTPDTSESSRDTVKFQSNPGNQINKNGEETGNTHSERRFMPYPEQFNNIQKRRNAPEAYKQWKSEFLKSLSEPDSDGNPTRGCSFREQNHGPHFWITIYPIGKRTSGASRKKLPSMWKNEDFQYFEIFSYPQFDNEEDQLHPHLLNEWANKVADIVSKPDEKGRPTRWYKILRIDYARELVIYSKDQPTEVIKSHDGPPITLDTNISSSLIRNEQPVGAGHSLRKFRKENTDSKSEGPSNPIGTPSTKSSSNRSKNSKFEISAEESILNQSTSSTGAGMNTSQSGSADGYTAQKRKIKSEKRALERGSEDGHTSLQKDQIDVSPTRSDKPQKKAKKRHHTLENGSSASASGSNSIPVTLNSRSEGTSGNSATPVKSAQPPASKTTTTTMQALPPSTNVTPSSSSSIPAPATAKAPLPPPASISNTTAGSAAVTSTSDPVREEIKPTLQPAPTSEKLEELNSSLRTKVNEIEKWTRLSNEFPDLKLALDNQIGKTREQIFGLYDDIALEKERIKMGGLG